jgi:hypothetical protein
MPVSPATVPAGEYIGGLGAFLYRVIREHVLLLTALPLVAMAIAYFAAQRIPPVYTAQGSVLIGRLEGMDIPAGAPSRINSLPFKQHLLRTLGPLSGGGKAGQLIFSSLAAKQETADTVAVTVRAVTEQQARDALTAVVSLLNEQQQKAKAALEADVGVRVAAQDQMIAGLVASKESLSAVGREDAKDATVDPAPAALRKIWLMDMSLRNDEQLNKAMAERRALLARIGGPDTHPAALLDDVYLSTASTLGSPVMVAILSGGAVFSLLLLAMLLRGPKVARPD